MARSGMVLCLCRLPIVDLELQHFKSSRYELNQTFTRIINLSFKFKGPGCFTRLVYILSVGSYMVSFIYAPL
jgi:hypothetical protein